MNINRQIWDSERITILRHEARRIDGHTNFSTKMARAQRKLADQLERELRFDALNYYKELS